MIHRKHTALVVDIALAKMSAELAIQVVLSSSLLAQPCLASQLAPLNPSTHRHCSLAHASCSAHSSPLPASAVGSTSGTSQATLLAVRSPTPHAAYMQHRQVQDLCQSQLLLLVAHWPHKGAALVQASQQHDLRRVSIALPIITITSPTSTSSRRSIVGSPATGGCETKYHVLTSTAFGEVAIGGTISGTVRPSGAAGTTPLIVTSEAATSKRLPVALAAAITAFALCTTTSALAITRRFATARVVRSHATHDAAH